jgi:mono/diheme cytochrome c family protein
VKEIERVPDKSFMPSYKGKLTDEQLNDLVAYLASLGGAK